MEDAQFFVHLEILAQHSKPLYTLATADMKEKEQGYAVLQGVTAETFSRFLEWIYWKTYTLPEPEKSIITEGENKTEVPLLTNVYLALAELYVFAQERDVQTLKVRALEHLHNTNSTASITRNHYGISTILKYIYENTTAGRGKVLEPLRAFAMNEFCPLFSVESLMASDDIEAVIRADDGELMKDFMWMLVRKPTLSSGSSTKPQSQESGSDKQINAQSFFGYSSQRGVVSNDNSNQYRNYFGGSPSPNPQGTTSQANASPPVFNGNHQVTHRPFSFDQAPNR